MSRIFLGKRFVAGILLGLVFSACVKNSSTPSITPGGTSITGIVKAASNLSWLDSALSKAGLAGTLDSTNPASVAAPFTLFAPLNIAFTGSPGFTDSTLFRYSKDSLLQLIGYHIYAGYGLKAAELPAGPDAKLVTLFGDTIYVTVSGGNIFINGNLITQTDVLASNGVVHALSGLLIPPYKRNLYQQLQNISSTTDTTLTFFVAALQRASSSIDLVSLLSGGGIFTVMAPNNAAFAAVGDTTIDVINSANADTLARMLQAHIIPSRNFSSDLPQSGYLLSYVGDSLFVNAGLGSPTIQSKGDSTTGPAGFISVNRVATNGVIHTINRVLMP